jgi:hypothetical protein
MIPYVIPYIAMEKTSVYLTDLERRRLARLARAERVSQAEVIRRAILAYEPHAVADRRFALAGSYDGPGGSIADIPEEEALRGMGE